MKNLNVIYQHDRFYSKETGKRIVLKEGVEFALLGDNVNFLDDDGINVRPNRVLNAQEKLEFVLSDKKVNGYVKLLDAGSYLTFSHGHRSRKNAEEKNFQPAEYLFLALICFNGQMADPLAHPDFWIIPSSRLQELDLLQYMKDGTTAYVNISRTVKQTVLPKNSLEVLSSYVEAH